MADIRRDDLVAAKLDSREVRGFVQDVRGEPTGQERVVVKNPGTGEIVDTNADRVEVEN